MKIAIGADHAGYELKEAIISKFKNDYDLKDFGTFSAERADYPDFAHAVADVVGEKSFELGILVCGSANGIAMTANKHQSIRAAVCWNNEITALSRQHNNANIICLPARFIKEEEAFEFITTFLTTQFEGGRHETRVNKISC